MTQNPKQFESVRSESETILRSMLAGLQLDSLTVTSLTVNLRFLRLPEVCDLSNEVWIYFDCESTFESQIDFKSTKFEGLESFFKNRASSIIEFYSLIGAHVDHAKVSPTGDLLIHFDNGRSVNLIRAEEAGWSVMDNSLDEVAEHSWFISNDGEALVVRTPSTS